MKAHNSQWLDTRQTARYTLSVDNGREDLHSAWETTSQFERQNMAEKYKNGPDTKQQLCYSASHCLSENVTMDMQLFGVERVKQRISNTVSR